MWDKREVVEFYEIGDCANCSKTQDLVTSIVSGLIGLEAELRRAFAIPAESQNSSQEARQSTLIGIYATK
jgi:hypothetical protein